MCGVAAIYAYRPEAPRSDREELRIIRDHMRNRGPDGKGEWFAADGRLALAHRRLAIIDLSDQAAQPMSSEDGHLVISFNGEIYNYKALRSALERKGYHFRTNSDTEVLLYLYAEYGPDMVTRLRGMFACVLWDDRRKTLLLVRDPYGIKPLYYADNGNTLRVASQVKALLAGGRVSCTPEPAGITGFYLFGSVPEPWTIYREIKAVPAGCYLLVDEHGISEPTRYFSIAETWKNAEREPFAEPEQTASEVRAALLDTVRHHMVADVPVGAFLSAGIDSATLVGLMSELQHCTGNNSTNIQTITLAFAEFTGHHHDESIAAARIAELYGTSHTTRLVGKDEFLEDLPKILQAMDQPTIDGMNTWFVAKAAKEQGLKVALSGLGGDELFGGYPSFRDIPNWVQRLGPISLVPMAGELLQKMFSFVSPAVKKLSPKTGGLIKYGGTYPGAWFLKRGLFMPWELDDILDQETVRQGLADLDPLGHIQRVLEPQPAAPFARVATLETCLYMRNQLLRDTDWASMAHSIEVRVPLVDPFVLRRLSSRLVQDSGEGKKYMGQSPKPPLPEEIQQRKKTGFTTPVGSWLHDTDLLTTHPLRTTRKKQHWSRSWALAVGDNEIL